MKNWRTIIAMRWLGAAWDAGVRRGCSQSHPAANFPDPGTLNYVEGTVNFDGKMLTNRNLTNDEMRAGEELTTGAGKAEILLTPGIFLRVDSNSAVKMISPDLPRPRLNWYAGAPAWKWTRSFPRTRSRSSTAA